MRIVSVFLNLTGFLCSGASAAPTACEPVFAADMSTARCNGINADRERSRSTQAKPGTGWRNA